MPNKYVVEIHEPKVTGQGNTLGPGELLHIISEVLYKNNKEYAGIYIYYKEDQNNDEL